MGANPNRKVEWPPFALSGQHVFTENLMGDQKGRQA